MAKRFTDTNKWRKDFIRSLQAPYKLLWLYILDECDHAGIWHVELDVASIRTGCSYNEEEVKNMLGSHIIVFDDGKKWFIPDFIDFQYGQLQETNRAHSSVIEQLKRYKNKGLKWPLQGAKDKDKDKEKEKDKDIEERQKLFYDEVGKYIEKYGVDMCQAFFNYWAEPNSKGKMKWEMQDTWSLSGRLSTWAINDKKFAK